MKRIILLCPFILLFISNPSFSQVDVGDSGTLKGRIFGDFFWFAQNHDADLEGNTGFWFRRIYLTYDREISDSFTSRVRLEASNNGDFINSSKMNTVIKDAYLKWAGGDHSVYVGLASTPTWGLVEDVWGYRSVEKSPLDLHDFGSSRDIGLKFTGKIGELNKIGYDFMIGNGNSNKDELNKGKKVMGSLSYRLTEHLVIEGYADFNRLPKDRDIYTLQGFLGYQSNRFNGGFLYAYQFRNNSIIAGGNQNLDLISVFTNFTLSDSWAGYLRADHIFDINFGAGGISYIPMSDQAEPTFIVAGADLSLESNVHIMPNIEMVFYGESDTGITPTTDIIPRITVGYRF